MAFLDRFQFFSAFSAFDRGWSVDGVGHDLYVVRLLPPDFGGHSSEYAVAAGTDDESCEEVIFLSVGVDPFSA